MLDAHSPKYIDLHVLLHHSDVSKSLFRFRYIRFRYKIDSILTKYRDIDIDAKLSRLEL